MVEGVTRIAIFSAKVTPFYFPEDSEFRLFTELLQFARNTMPLRFRDNDTGDHKIWFWILRRRLRRGSTFINEAKVHIVSVAIFSTPINENSCGPHALRAFALRRFGQRIEVEDQEHTWNYFDGLGISKSMTVTAKPPTAAPPARAKAHPVGYPPKAHARSRGRGPGGLPRPRSRQAESAA